MSGEDDWEALAESSEALDKVVSSNPNLMKHADEDKITEVAPEQVAVPSKPKQPKKVVGEEFDKKQKAKPKTASESTPAVDSISEKLRRQQMEEDADHQLADELFEDMPKVALDSEDSFKQYAQQVNSHLGTGLPHRIPVFLRELMRTSSVFLTSAHLLDVSQTLTALLTEKQKQEKGPEGKKKKTNSKPTLKGVSKKASAQDFGSDEDLPEDDDEFGDFM